jgi:hypothetical protein
VSEFATSRNAATDMSATKWDKRMFLPERVSYRNIGLVYHTETLALAEVWLWVELCIITWNWFLSVAILCTPR